MKINETPDEGATLLALETAAPVCSVALLHQGELSSRKAEGTGIHSEKTFLFIQELLERRRISIPDLDAVVVTSGPGSYTGLRIASSAAKGLLFGTSVRLIEVETLAGIAFGALSKIQKGRGRIHAVLNARRTHLYHQFFYKDEAGALTTETEAQIVDISDIQAMLSPGDIVAGTGLQRLNLPKGIGIVEASEALDAAHLIGLITKYGDRYGKFADPASFEPSYQVPEG